MSTGSVRSAMTPKKGLYFHQHATRLCIFQNLANCAGVPVVGQDPRQRRFANIVCGTDVELEPTKTLPDIETVDAALNLFRHLKSNFTRRGFQGDDVDNNRNSPSSHRFTIQFFSVNNPVFKKYLASFRWL